MPIASTSKEASAHSKISSASQESSGRHGVIETIVAKTSNERIEPEM